LTVRPSGRPTVRLLRPLNLQFTALAVGKGDHDNLQVILIGTDGLAYLMYQINSSGNWYWYGRLPTP